MVWFLDCSEYVTVSPELGVAVGLLVGIAVVVMVGATVGMGVANGAGVGEELLFMPPEYQNIPTATATASTPIKTIKAKLALRIPLLSIK
jgi:hypothetical protein